MLLLTALQFYRRTEDVSNDMEEMDTEFQQKAPVRKTTSKATDVEKLAAAAAVTAADTDPADESKEYARLHVQIILRIDYKSTQIIDYTPLSESSSKYVSK